MIPFSPGFRLALALLLALAVFGAGLWLGVEWESGRVAKQEVARRSAVIDGLIAERERARKTNSELQLRLSASLERRERDRQSFDRRLRDAKPQELARCEPAVAGAGESDVVALTPAFVGLYNDAACVGSDAPACAARADDPAFGAGFVVPKDILANVEANAAACAGDRLALKLWQDWARLHGLAR